MIFFVPSYDPATKANLKTALRMTAPSDVVLSDVMATRGCLAEALRAHATEPLFSMSHGRPEYLCAQGGGAALTEQDADVVGRRSVYAFACHTATRLGQRMSQCGVTWWGYTGTIQCPDASAALGHLFVDLFRFIRESFALASTRTERCSVLEEIARRCEDAQAVVDESALADPDAEVWAAYHCLLHIWDRLRVWAPDLVEPDAHPAAAPPSLFESD